MTQLADLRRTYVLGSLSETDVAPDPMSQFKRWFDEAVTAKLPEPNAMTLATVDADGQPSARIVLLKGIDDRGFTFFTNYESRKGLDLAANPRAALLFHWVQLERQVRVEGRVEKVSDDESDAYFATRPLGSRVGAWASAQSREVPGRDVLEQREQEYRSKFGENPPRPRTGAATAWCRPRWSSGRAARRGCTTASPSACNPEATGRSCGCRPEAVGARLNMRQQRRTGR